MTRKDYNRIVDAIKDAKRLCPSKAQAEAIDVLTGSLVAIFEDDNPRFDASRFYAALFA